MRVALYIAGALMPAWSPAMRMTSVFVCEAHGASGLGIQPVNVRAHSRNFLHGVSCSFLMFDEFLASRLAVSLPTSEMPARRNWGLQSQAGRPLHSTPERSCLDNSGPFGDVLH